MDTDHRTAIWNAEICARRYLPPLIYGCLQSHTLDEAPLDPLHRKVQEILATHVTIESPPHKALEIIRAAILELFDTDASIPEAVRNAFVLTESTVPKLIAA